VSDYTYLIMIILIWGTVVTEVGPAGMLQSCCVSGLILLHSHVNFVKSSTSYTFGTCETFYIHAILLKN
jgi:hypothetical protein